MRIPSFLGTSHPIFVLMPLEMDILNALEHYCAYRERSPKEVQNKAHELGVSDVQHYLKELESSGHLNEERFADSYALGKWRNNRWGRLKIRQGLQQKGVRRDLIEKALLDIPNDEYSDGLLELIRYRLGTQKLTYSLRVKTMRYLQQKGYETSLSVELMDLYQKGPMSD
jgi:regulatory protein